MCMVVLPVCKSVHCVQAQFLLRLEEGLGSPRTGVGRLLGAVVWVLGIKPGFLGRKASKIFSLEPSFQPAPHKFSLIPQFLFIQTSSNVLALCFSSSLLFPTKALYPDRYSQILQYFEHLLNGHMLIELLVGIYCCVHKVLVDKSG